ncbi:MAG TPA: acyl-CoA dehydrogenase family protein [Ktedonobacterales bacterium]|jgi:citronellyl-CoA dehydrogenase|nr:acyl-CoA dehydrogenase family protein [Ktedonobacterales bacterium]
MYFNDEHEMFRQTVRRFVEQEINPHVDEWEDAGIFPAHELFKKMGDLGFLGLTYPEEYGGLDLDFWYTVVFCEELGRANCSGVPMGITVHTDMCTPALAHFGSPQLKKQFLEPSIRGEYVGCIGVSEPDAGSDVASIRTRAVADGDDWIITGRKLYITNGTQADWVCLLARTSDEAGYRGMSLIIVPTNTPGFSVGRKLRKLGNHSSDTAELVLDGVRVPKANTIGDEGMGFILQMQQFQRERLVGAILAYGQCEHMVRETIAYTSERRAFGQPLIANQVIHFRLAELLTEVELLRQLCYHCVRKYVAGYDITREASMAKLKAGRLSREVADACLQYYGGMGYMEETPISRAFRDSRLLSIGGGADEVMLGIIAKLEGILPGKRKD